MATVAVAMLNQSRAEPLESRSHHGQTSLALLAIERVDPDFNAAVWTRTEQEPVVLLGLHHVGEFAREHVVAAVFALLLPRDRVQISNRQMLVQSVCIELSFRTLGAFVKVYDRRDFYVRISLVCFRAFEFCIFRAGLASMTTVLPVILVVDCFEGLFVDEDVQVGE